MERFLSNYKPPPPKKSKVSEEDQLEKNRKYETEKRKRAFNPSWKNTFKWLDYHVVNGEGKMFCSICRRYDHANTFSVGNTNFKLETVKAHARSEGHKKNQLKFDAKTKPENTAAHKMLVQMNKKTMEQLEILFRSAHALAKHGRPYSDFKWLCMLDEAKGLKLGSTYRNDKRCRDFVKAIATDLRRGTMSLVKEAPFLSLISDGATDSSHKEAEVAYVRFALHGETFIKFVGLKNIGKADADGISNALNVMMTGSFGEVWKTKVVGFGTDGANVMLGSNNGTVKKIKDQLERPYILPVHCSAHRLELAYKDACKKVLLYQKVDTMMLNLYLFYRNSPLNRSNLVASFNALDKSPLMPTRVSGTRWLAHAERAAKNLIGGFGAIVTHLKQVC